MISIMLPTYNERENLPILIEKIISLKLNVKLIIIDDNSPDGTGKLADKLAEKYKNIRVYHRYHEKGLGSAIKFGFEKTRSDFVGVMDTDLSHNPKTIVEIFKKIKEGADFIIGSRYVDGGGIREWPFLRRFISKIATWMVKPLTHVKDPMSGFFFIKKDVIRNMEINPESCKICLDIIVRGRYKKIVEVPYIFTNRKKGKTKIFTPREIMKYLKYIAYLYSYKIKKHR